MNINTSGESTGGERAMKSETGKKKSTKEEGFKVNL